MLDEPQGRSAGGSIHQPGPEYGPDPPMLEDVAEPGWKRNAADTEWLSMATADPAYFLKDPHAE